MIASAVRSNAACANISIQIRPVTAKIVPNTSPTIVACSTPARPWTGVVDQSNHPAREKDDPCLSPPDPEAPDGALEHVPAENGLFSKTRTDNQRTPFQGSP